MVVIKLEVITMYYAADNSMASETSVGFANTWFVLAFESKKYRDKYVNEKPSLAARPIKRTEITNYVGKPKPFSGEHLALTFWDCHELPDGAEGYVEITGEYNPLYLSRLNK